MGRLCVTGVASSGCSVPELTRAGGQDCDGPIGAAGPYRVTAHPVSKPPNDSPVGDDRQIKSEDRRSVKLWVRPPRTGTHQCRGSDADRQGHSSSQSS